MYFDIGFQESQNFLRSVGVNQISSNRAIYNAFMANILHDGIVIPNPIANTAMRSFNTSLLFDTKLDATTTSSVPCPENVSGSLVDSPYATPVEDSWYYPYSLAEVIWGVLLVAGIFGVNIWILWVVGRSRELWKPRHLWMACLCITDLFVGAHKIFELMLLIFPGTLRELCIIQKATLGIPYVVNMLLLTLLSLDRFIAVRYPFFYSASVSNKHVSLICLRRLKCLCMVNWDLGTH